MSEPVETHRSMVKAWECDSFGHFTVAYYFDRFADASAGANEKLGLPEGWLPVEYTARFIAELRAGEVFHIETGVIAAAESSLRLGHRLINSATGKLCTTIEERLAANPDAASMGAGQLAALRGRTVHWEEGSKDDPGLADHATEGLMVTARDHVRPTELDWTSHLALPGYVHRSSIGCIQLLTAMGLSPDYLREYRRGFSTFEIKLALERPRPAAGAPLMVSSGLMQLGMSSVRMLHRISDPRDGRRVAMLRQSGVHFDLEARRSTPIPDDLRARASHLVLR